MVKKSNCIPVTFHIVFLYTNRIALVDEIVCVTMSFITKRERVFNEYDLFDLPARNEGKLKAYASCTDARAWSHFCSDKTEHLVEIIKRNNDTCRPKYVPTDVIVDTLMVAKNAEIGRLKHKIEEFEQMLTAYDQLDLTCEQKCEIANAHAAIKAANKELDDMFLDLDLSGFTEGMESDAFETGKSRGDELSKGKPDGWVVTKEAAPVSENKSNQAGLACPCDASTNAQDPRIQEMQEALINKDAKLSAMQNTIAVMENDVCEPYCIYAHIYTALEKIFGILCQNDKYKLYLNLMTAGKDTRCIDIKGKILFKLKVFEKFCQALIAPCSQDMANSPSQTDCSCYRAEVLQQMLPTTTYALTSAEIQQPNSINRRAQLVADIMQNEEMKEILSKESFSDHTEDVDELIENYDIESENLKRLKKLQEDYDDLMNCYEALKNEKDELLLKCQQYEVLDNECTGLRSQLREYNLLWNEKEHYRKRSADLDLLKEQFYILSDETTTIETQLKAETEINKIKANTIEELRKENVALEKKLNDALILFEKEKSMLQCKLQETECKCMCQEQQIKSLSVQMDRLLEQEPEKAPDHGDPAQTIMLMDQIESLKEQIKNLKETLCCNEEEKQNLQDEFQDNLKTINDLKIQIEEWKSSYEKTINRNNNLEDYVQNFEDEINKLSQDLKDKTKAIENLMNVNNNKSQEINKLLGDIEEKEKQNNDLLRRLHEFKDIYENNMSTLENEKENALESLSLAKRESAELLNKLKDYDDVVQSQSDMSKSLNAQIDRCRELKKALLDTIEDNKKLQINLKDREKSNTNLLNQIQRLKEQKTYTDMNLKDLDEERNKYKSSLEVTRKKSEILETHFESLSQELQNLREAYEYSLAEKRNLEKELRDTKYKLEDATCSFELCKKESKELKEKLSDTDSLYNELTRLKDAYRNLMIEKKDLNHKLSNLQKSFDDLQIDNNYLLKISNQIPDFERNLRELEEKRYELEAQKRSLQNDLDKQNEMINSLNTTLDTRTEENKRLLDQILYLQSKHKAVRNDLNDIQNENLTAKMTLEAIRKESYDLRDKLKDYETLKADYENLYQGYEEIKLERDQLQAKLHSQLKHMKQFEQENNELHKESMTLMQHSEDLQNALVDARTQLIEKSDDQDSILLIKREIEEMKKEKIKNIDRIRDLSNELDETENIISNLTQNISARDDKITILENHINKLKDEVAHLHGYLTEVIDTGEEIKSTSYEKIGQSMKNMEAHHSKATHNMKMELAKLHNEKVKLEAQMSLSKLKTEESIRENTKCMSQLVQYQNEREIIVTYIKQLEFQSIGDSLLSPSNCDIKDISESLERIRQYIEAKNVKNNSLEQALLKVQRSSQVLVSEAKDLVEKEKQKIINEKEEAIRDKQSLQKQLEDQKTRLETLLANDMNVINDLKAELLNQKLIKDKLNESTARDVSKLEGELHSLQKMYQNAMAEVNELQEKNSHLSEQSAKHLDIIHRLKEDLKDKSNEILKLQEALDFLKEKPTNHTGSQTVTLQIKSHTTAQTETIYSKDGESIREPVLYGAESQNQKTSEDSSLLIKLPKKRQHSVNEVQILTANVEPTFDFVKNSYLNYKLKQLSIGHLEQQSISNDEVSLQEDVVQCSGSVSYNTEQIQTDENQIVDLYNRKSLHTDSSQPGTSNSKTNYKDTTITSFFGGSDQTNTSKNVKYTDTNKSNKTDKKDKDLFVIYKESENDFENKPRDGKSWNVNNKSELLVEVLTVDSPKNKKKKSKGNNEQQNKKNKGKDKFDKENAEDGDDNSVKPKLKIHLPRVATDSQSNPTTSEGDRKSLDSYSMAIYLSPKETHSDNKVKTRSSKKNISQETPSLPTLSNDENHQTNSNNSFKIPVYDNDEKVRMIYDSDNGKEQKTDEPLSDKSVHELSRVEADVFLIKENKGSPRKENEDYGLQYILDAIRKENDIDLPESISYYNDKTMQKSRSDGIFQNAMKTSESVDPMKTSTGGWSPSKISDRTRSRSVVDRSVMVKIENTEEYEARINYLSKALQNVEKDCKKKIEAIKIQYDSNIKSIINEHNTGVKSIQNLHEETLQDIIKIHENEVENLRTLSIEAMRRSEKLEKENRALKSKISDFSASMDAEPARICCSETRKRRKSRTETRNLTKTNVEAFNVLPKAKSHGPCTCSLDINLSDTIRNIFEQVDLDQRKMAENTYTKYIANKILGSTIEALDAQELSFLHLKVCRAWKSKLNKEELLQKKIDTLEHELMSKQRNAQQHIAELDRKVAEERRRLQEVREAVCRTPSHSRNPSPCPDPELFLAGLVPPAPPPTAVDNDLLCDCSTGVTERRSAGDLAGSFRALKPKRAKEINRAVLARLDAEDRRDKKLYHDEPPTRLRRPFPPHPADRHRPHKK